MTRGTDESLRVHLLISGHIHPIMRQDSGIFAREVVPDQRLLVKDSIAQLLDGRPCPADIDYRLPSPQMWECHGSVRRPYRLIVVPPKQGDPKSGVIGRRQSEGRKALVRT